MIFCHSVSILDLYRFEADIHCRQGIFIFQRLLKTESTKFEKKLHSDLIFFHSLSILDLCRFEADIPRRQGIFFFQRLLNPDTQFRVKHEMILAFRTLYFTFNLPNHMTDLTPPKNITAQTSKVPVVRLTTTATRIEVALL